MIVYAQTKRFISLGTPSYFNWEFYACLNIKAVNVSKPDTAIERV